MGPKCVIISGGEYSPPLLEGDCVIACDKGYSYALRAGLKPDLVVGDFDSCTDELPSDIPVLRYKKEKDDTDTMLAVRYALERGFRELLLLCALGGRLDHCLANLQCAAFAAERGADVSILSEDTRIYLLRSGTKELPRLEGFSLSVLAHSERCLGVTLRGVKYPLTDATLESSVPLGVSNAWSGDRATVTVADGTLMIVLSRM